MFRKYATLLTLFVVVTGCKNNTPKLVPVAGKVVFGQKPVRGAMVMFIADDAKGTHAPAALGQTDAEGHFSMRSPPLGKGVLPGHYHVTIAAAESDATPVPNKYGLPNGTPLHIEVPETGLDNLSLIVQD